MDKSSINRWYKDINILIYLIHSAIVDVRGLVMEL